MLEQKTLDFVKMIERDAPNLKIDNANVFYYILKKYLTPVYKPQKERQDCLFIGVRSGEVYAAKKLLRDKYGYLDDRIFTVGINLDSDTFSEKACNIFLGYKSADARKPEIYEKIEDLTGLKAFDLIFLRRPDMLSGGKQSIADIVNQARLNLDSDGVFVSTSSLRDEDTLFKEVMESSGLTQLVSSSTRLHEDYYWDTEGYIFIGKL